MSDTKLKQIGIRSNVYNQLKELKYERIAEKKGDFSFSDVIEELLEKVKKIPIKKINQNVDGVKD